MKVNKIDSIAKKIKPTKKSAKKGTVQQPVKKLKAKEYPNWVGLPGENYGGKTVLCKIVFYPDDLEKMKNMSKKEAEAYKDRLFFEHRYYEEENKPIVFSERAIQFMKEHNLELERFIVH